MKETEKIEIMHFDQEGYLEDGRNVYGSPLYICLYLCCF